MDSSFLTYLSLSIGMVTALALGYERYRNGSRTMTKEIMEAYETRQKQLEEQITVGQAVFDKFKIDTQSIIDGYRNEITRLKTSNDEKDTHNKTLTDMLLDKNPDVLKLLTAVTLMMKEQTRILKKIDKRNDGINQASIAHK